MATEVFNRIGEAEIHSEDYNFYNRTRGKNNGFETSDKIEFTSKPISKAKKEFLKHLENDSLTIDTCSKLNQDWGKR